MSAAVARIGWTETTFIPELDNGCQKLADAGARGPQGGIGIPAGSREARLDRCALSTRLVREYDLTLLDARASLNATLAGFGGRS